MEYLNNIHDNLKKRDESNIKYINLLEHPEFFYGNVNFTSSYVDFTKAPKLVQNIKSYGLPFEKSMEQFKESTTGNRLRFHTTSKTVIFKVKLSRSKSFIKMNNWNSMGFDVYAVDNDKYIHKAIFAPMDGHRCFAKEIKVPKNGKLCVFLPTYTTIEEMYLGIEKDSKISLFNYSNQNKIPIMFYGNSITQGSSASRSGNIFPNIISRKLNRDIINLSISNCCKGMDGMADLIGKINCHSIVIDYTRNATNNASFANSLKKFYLRIRDFHPDKKIILMTSSSFNYYKRYYDFDKIVIDFYKERLSQGDNILLLNQKELFSEDEYDYVTIDPSHYSDYGMHKVANALIKLLK